MSNKITFYERQRLEYWLRTKMSLRAIAKIMRRKHGTLSKEIKNNGKSDRKRYRADVAQKLSEIRQHKQRISKLDKNPALKKYIDEKIIDDWSPEQIAGRLKTNPIPELKGLSISHESIYQYIYYKADKYKKLYIHLRTNRPKRQKYRGRKTNKSSIKDRKSIHERPDFINDKKRYGDWESDTVEFTKKRKNPYLSVQFERKSQLIRINKMINKKAEETKEALIKMAESLPERELLKTITFDNGTEGSEHFKIKEIFDIETYFCDPYCSWQKGGVENANKLIRQYLPRNTDMNKISEDNIHTIQEKLNNRPRKGLNYKTPNEIILEMVPS